MVRLYPVGVSNSVMEQLAGVPAGTADRLVAFTHQRSEMGEDAWHDKLFEDDDLHTLSSFDVFGWGSVRPNVARYIQHKNWCSYVGKASGDDARSLLRFQGVTVPEGIEPFDVTWN